MKTPLFSCILFLIATAVQAQATFQSTFGGPGDDVANWVEETATGYLICGYTTTGSNQDGYLINLDLNGNIQWQKRYGGAQAEEFAVALDFGNEYLVAGQSQSYGTGGYDAWLLKTNAAGAILWSKTIGIPDNDDYITSIVKVPGNRILLSGYTGPIGFSSFESCFYLIDANGNIQWSKRITSGSSGNLLRSEYVDNGVIYASGGAESDAAFLRLDLETGAVINGLVYQGASTEALYFTQPTADGNLLLCDHTHSNSPSNGIEMWVKKVSREGQTIWSKLYNRPGDNLRGRIEAAGDGNYLLTPFDGYFGGLADALLAKIDPDGNIMWSRNYGQAGIDWLWKSRAASDGGIISVGAASNDNGNLDVLVVKTDAEGLVEGCCIPPGRITASFYGHTETDNPYSDATWVEPEARNVQQVNANLQKRAYCGNHPMEIFNDIGLCPAEPFLYNGVEYYAPDDIVEIHPGLYGCDTTIHLALIVLPQTSIEQTLRLCPGEQFHFNGQSFSAPDTLTTTITSSNGCDTLLRYFLVEETDPAACITCYGTFLKTVGDPGIPFRGYGVYSAGDGNLYVTGSKRDSCLIVKMTPGGNIIWARVFDILPGAFDYLSEIIVDSDGMIVGCGQSNDVQPTAGGFAFRYDPENNTLLWVQRILDGSPFVMGILEKSPGGNYILNSNPHEPVNNAQFTELARSDGSIVPGPFTKQLNLGSADNFNSALISNGKLFAVGRFTDGVDFSDMRHTIARFDLATGQLERITLRHLFDNVPARLYGMDLTLDNTFLATAGFGDETGDDLNNSRIFLYISTQPDGVDGPTYRIDFQEMAADAVEELVRVPDGFILLCRSITGNSADLFLLKVNTIGQAVWSKKIDFGFDEFLPVSIVQSQILVHDGMLYCVATTSAAGSPSQMLVVKMTLDGTMDGGCDYLKNTPVTVELIPTSFGYSVIPEETSVGNNLESLAVAAKSSIPACQGWCKPMGLDTLVQVDLCPGESVVINGQTYSQSGTVIDTIHSTSGCDTIFTYVIELLPQPILDRTVQFCPGESVVIGGQSYNQSGTVVDTIPGLTGCDTIVTYTLVLLPQPVRAQTIEFCPGTSVLIGNQSYSQSGTVVDTIPGLTGCDTIVTYTLVLLPQPARAQTIEFCPGTSVLIGNQSYSQSGTVVDTIPGLTGCDTIITYTLVLLSHPTRAQTVTFCPGESIVIGGNTYTQPGVVIDTIPAATGCDTIVTYTLQSLLPAPSVVSIQCPAGISIIAEPGTAPLAINYTLPVTSSNCPCPGIDLLLTSGLPPGGLFPNSTTQVCYRATDACGHTATCCFGVTVREIQPCDVKVIGCMKYELLSITADAAKNQTYRIRVTNSCPNKMIYTAIQQPDGTTAISPAHLSVFTTEDGNDYEVRNPNFTPFYSIRFKSIDDSIANGESDIFKYTLKAQNDPDYIHVTSRLAPQLFFEAYLNTFYCPVGASRPAPREDSETSLPVMPVLYPNPTDGVLWIDPADWADRECRWRVFNSQAQLLTDGVLGAAGEPQRIDLPDHTAGGLYFFEIFRENGERAVFRFVVQR